MDFGLSFNPGQQQQPGMDPQQGGSQTPIQDAIKTLSLRIPTFRGPGMAPMPLMTSPGSGGMMGGQGMPGGLQQILSQIFGRMGPGQAPMPGQAPSGVPLPNFKPGQEGVPSGPLSPSGPAPSGPVTNIGGYDAPQDPGHFFPGQWP